MSDLIELLDGVFEMGSQQFHPDEGPAHDRHVEPFAIEHHRLTNAQFSRFIAEIGMWGRRSGRSARRCFPAWQPRI